MLAKTITAAEEWLETTGCDPESSFHKYLRSGVMDPRASYCWCRLEDFRHRFGFGVLTYDLLQYIKQFSPLLEIGAGNGYWSYEFTAAGVDYLATDPKPGEWPCFMGLIYPGANIEKLTGIDAMLKYPTRNVIWCWPEYDKPYVSETLTYFEEGNGEFFIYIGEGRGGCTGDDRFHDILELHFRLVDSYPMQQFEGLHDHLWVYQKLRK